MPELGRTAAPAVAPVSLAEVKEHCAIDDDTHDGVLAELIAAATDRVDGACGLLGRCLITQAWRYVLERFPRGEIVLPLPPCQTVDAITYVDAAGVTRVLPPGDYQASGLATAWPARIRPALGACWPAIGGDAEAVAVSFTAGYGDAPTDVPAAIRAAIKMHVASLFAYRESVSALDLAEVPAGAGDLLAPYKLLSF